MKQKISKNETEWIYKLNTRTPLGMNIAIDLNCFIANY